MQCAQVGECPCERAGQTATHAPVHAIHQAGALIGVDLRLLPAPIISVPHDDGAAALLLQPAGLHTHAEETLQTYCCCTRSFAGWVLAAACCLCSVGAAVIKVMLRHQHHSNVRNQKEQPVRSDEKTLDNEHQSPE